MHTVEDSISHYRLACAKIAFFRSNRNSKANMPALYCAPTGMCEWLLNFGDDRKTTTWQKRLMFYVTQYLRRPANDNVPTFEVLLEHINYPYIPPHSHIYRLPRLGNVNGCRESAYGLYAHDIATLKVPGLPFCFLEAAPSRRPRASRYRSRQFSPESGPLSLGRQSPRTWIIS